MSTKILITEQRAYDAYAAILDDCTPEEYCAGSQWYATASNLVNNIAVDTCLPHWKVAGFIAACSPATSWQQQVNNTLPFIQWILGGECGDKPKSCTLYTQNALKGIAILRGGSLEDNLRGPKVNNFHLNLMGHMDYVTVDSWMVYGAGLPKDTPLRAGLLYDTLAAAISRLARDNGVEPAVMQAILWVVIRARCGYRD